MSSFCKYSESREQRQIEKQSFSGFDSAGAHPVLSKYSESRVQRLFEKQSFSAFDSAEAHPILFKYSESREQRLFEKQSFSGFGYAEAHPILSKYIESRGQRLFEKQSFSGFGYAEAQHIHFSNIENTLRKAKPRIAARTYTPSRFLLSDTLHALQDTKKTPAKASFSSHDAPAAANRPPRRRNTYPPSGRRSRGAPSS